MCENVRSAHNACARVVVAYSSSIKSRSARCSVSTGNYASVLTGQTTRVRIGKSNNNNVALSPPPHPAHLGQKILMSDSSASRQDVRLGR